MRFSVQFKASTLALMGFVYAFGVCVGFSFDDVLTASVLVLGFLGINYALEESSWRLTDDPSGMGLVPPSMLAAALGNMTGWFVTCSLLLVAVCLAEGIFAVDDEP